MSMTVTHLVWGCRVSVSKCIARIFIASSEESGGVLVEFDYDVCRVEHCEYRESVVDVPAVIWIPTTPGCPLRDGIADALATACDRILGHASQRRDSAIFEILGVAVRVLLARAEGTS
jgi:hypothetical protein